MSKRIKSEIGERQGIGGEREGREKCVEEGERRRMGERRRRGEDGEVFYSSQFVFIQVWLN